MQVRSAEDDAILRSACLSEVDMIIDAGYSKPVSVITIDEKDELAQVLRVHYTLLKNKAEMDQLKNGLSELGVGEAMNKYPDLLEQLFLAAKSTPLTAGIYNYYISSV